MECFEQASPLNRHLMMYGLEGTSEKRVVPLIALRCVSFLRFVWLETLIDCPRTDMLR